jgi:transcriptional regulator with XRE-family HTH domain
MNKCPTSTRLKGAREFRGITAEELCRELHIDLDAYNKWEEVDKYGGEGTYNYDIPPSSEIIGQIANYLDFPLSWFYADEMQLSQPGYFSWTSGSQTLDDEIQTLLESKVKKHLKEAT